jgi:tetratricopeptide (TPR) repeat protein
MFMLKPGGFSMNIESFEPPLDSTSKTLRLTTHSFYSFLMLYFPQLRKGVRRPVEKPQSSSTIELFYSYSHKDEGLRDQLENHLAMLKRKGIIKGWHDRRISAGREWEGQIDEHLNSSDIILLLVSSDFLASDYCYDVEVKRAMERHEAGEARVIPVILRPCDWQSAPFGKLEALPKDVKPVTRWEDRDEAFLDVARGIRIVAEEISETREIETSQSPESPKGTPPPHIPNYLIVDFVRRRDREDNDIIERLKRELAPDEKRLIVLWGAGGVGKTAIATETARALVDTFAGRIAWVSADGRESFTLSALLDEVAHQLGRDDLRPLAIESKKEAVRDVVTKSATLIVLDNFETIAPDEAKHCSDWLAQPALCSALITTRQIIEGVRNIPIETMRPEEAHDLLGQLIAQAREPEAFINLDRERVIKTAEANPLVLQWIFGQINLAQDPDEVLDDLSHGEGDAAKRVFDRSYNLPQLNNGGRAVLLALALFVPSATRPMLAAVAGSNLDKDKKRFREATKTLASLWLVHMTDDGKRLAVGGLTRELAIAHLLSDPRGKTFRPRFVSHFLRYARFHQRENVADFNALEDERDNIFNAMDIAYGMEDWRSVMNICYGLDTFLELRGYWDEAIQRGEQALQAARNAHADIDISNIAHNVAVIYQQQGKMATAHSLFNESLEIQKILGNQIGIANTMYHLGMLAQDEGDIEEALQLYNGSLEISKKLGYQDGISASLQQSGVLKQEKGDVEEALGLYNESLEIAKRLGNQSTIAASLHNLGSLKLADKQFEEAEDFFKQSLSIIKRLGNKIYLAKCLESIGKLRLGQNRYSEARTLLDEALTIAEKISAKLRIGNIKYSLGLLAERENNRAEAERLFREALSLFEKSGSHKAKAVRDDLERLLAEQ